MSAHGSAQRKLFNVELPARVAEVLRLVEMRARQPVNEVRGESADVAPLVGFFDDSGRPFIAYREKSGAPPLELLALEISRLYHRNNKFEKNMPYAEMRHPVNQKLCRRLYRVLEEEIVISETASLDIPIRPYLRDYWQAHLLDPLQAGKYRAKEADPGRMREGSLDALEAAIAEYDERAAKRLGITIAELDSAIARPFGLMQRVVEQHRPFDGADRVKAAYYLAVPFLFDARKPTTPITNVRSK
jgi:hypothetical protein